MVTVPCIPTATGLKIAEAAAHGLEAAIVACGVRGALLAWYCDNEANDNKPDGVVVFSEASTVQLVPVTAVTASAVVPTPTPRNASELGEEEARADVDAVVPVPVPLDD